MTVIPWEFENPVKESRLTGRWRPRIQKWTGKMVVQVQIENTHHHMFDKKASGVTYVWRDATPYDMGMLAGKFGPSFDTVPPLSEGAA